jgi:hypothetical protein
MPIIEALTHGITRLRRAFAEMGYAQTRLFELRTGVPTTRRAPHH